jgi:hypothetical protein
LEAFAVIAMWVIRIRPVATRGRRAALLDCALGHPGDGANIHYLQQSCLGVAWGEGDLEQNVEVLSPFAA